MRPVKCPVPACPIKVGSPGSMIAHLRVAHEQDPAAKVAAAMLDTVFEWSAKEEAALRGE